MVLFPKELCRDCLLVICGNDLGGEEKEMQVSSSTLQREWGPDRCQKGFSLISWAVKVNGKRCTFRFAGFCYCQPIIKLEYYFWVYFLSALPHKLTIDEVYFPKAFDCRLKLWKLKNYFGIACDYLCINNLLTLHYMNKMQIVPVYNCNWNWNCHC